MTIEQAVSTMQIDSLANAQKQEAQELLLLEVVRMRSALKFYADPENWLDAVPMLADFSIEDNGHTARAALRLNDYIGEPVLAIVREEGMSSVQ